MALPMTNGNHRMFSLFKNMEGKIINSNLELATLVLHEATLLAAVPTVRMSMPRSGSDNIPAFL